MSGKKNRRKLSDDDLAVWNRVAGTVAPIETPYFEDLLDAPKSKRREVQASIPPNFEIKSRATAKTRIDLTPNTSEVLRNAAPQMDRKNFDRLRKGKLAPTRRVDLHGMTAQAAHDALMRFIMTAHADGARVVLVITGKGRTHGDPNAIIPQRKGIIRQSVPEWLRQSPLRERVVQVLPAHKKHGGDGAYYVYLRRRR